MTNLQASVDPRKQKQIAKFSWHEAVLKDHALARMSSAYRLAGYIMHKFNIDSGYAEFSNKSAAEYLNCDPRQIVRAKQRLVARGWIVLESAPKSQRFGWRASRYRLSGGPDDLLLDAKSKSSDADDD
jgi:hypothetical protein